MSGVRTWLAGGVLVALGGGLLLTPTSRAADVGYVEDFALAKDRTVALKQLIPGTDDYYYYHCLHYLNTAQFDKSEATLNAWQARYGINPPPRSTEIRLRQSLLTYDKNPQQTLTFLKSHLGLRF